MIFYNILHLLHPLGFVFIASVHLRTENGIEIYRIIISKKHYSVENLKQVADFLRQKILFIKQQIV